jgi:hypothetical protein
MPLSELRFNKLAWQQEFNVQHSTTQTVVFSIVTPNCVAGGC